MTRNLRLLRIYIFPRNVYSWVLTPHSFVKANEKAVTRRGSAVVSSAKETVTLPLRKNIHFLRNNVLLNDVRNIKLRWQTWRCT